MRLSLVPTLGAVALFALAVPACGGNHGGRGDGATQLSSGGFGSSCPTDPVDVVVSVAPWADLVAASAGDCATVTTVVRGDVDPHEFEPTPRDLAALDEAQVVVVNGLGYDHWAAEALDAVDSSATVIDAGEVAGRRTGDNPHLWYDPDVVAAMATAVGDALRTALPGAADYLRSRATVWDDAIAPYRAAVARLAGAATSPTRATYLATEPVFDPMAAHLGMTDETPDGFHRAAANETDPSPGDIAEVEDRLRDGVDVVIVNVQTMNPTTARIRELARREGIAMLDVTETQPAGATFGEWQTAQLDALAKALGR